MIMNQITINGISFDPTAAGPVTAALAKTDAADSDYILVQTNGPLTDSQRSQLEKLGAVIHEYVSENTSLCTFKPTSLTKVRALNFVTWAGVYMEGFKIPPNLRESSPLTGTASLVPRAPVPSTRRTRTRSISCCTVMSIRTTPE